MSVSSVRGHSVCENEHRSTNFYRDQRTILESCSITGRPPVNVIWRDFGMFIANLFLWPLHGYRALVDQMIFIILFPVFVPFLVLSIFVHIIMNILTCGNFSGFQLKFEYKEASSSEIKRLEKVIQCHEKFHLSKNQLVTLLHPIESYLNHIESYELDRHSKRCRNLQALIKINIDGKTKLFKFSPFDDHDAILHRYIHFLRDHADHHSSVKCTFVRLDYNYFIGMCDLQTKTDIVDINLLEGSVENNAMVPSFLSSWLRPKLGRSKGTGIRVHSHFAFWPGNTRRIVCDVINESLRGNDLNEYHITLNDLKIVN